MMYTAEALAERVFANPQRESKTDKTQCRNWEFSVDCRLECSPQKLAFRQRSAVFQGKER